MHWGWQPDIDLWLLMVLWIIIMMEFLRCLFKSTAWEMSYYFIALLDFKSNGSNDLDNLEVTLDYSKLFNGLSMKGSIIEHGKSDINKNYWLMQWTMVFSHLLLYQILKISFKKMLLPLINIIV